MTLAPPQVRQENIDVLHNNMELKRRNTNLQSTIKKHQRELLRLRSLLSKKGIAVPDSTSPQAPAGANGMPPALPVTCAWPVVFCPVCSLGVFLRSDRSLGAHTSPPCPLEHSRSMRPGSV